MENDERTELLDLLRRSFCYLVSAVESTMDTDTDLEDLVAQVETALKSHGILPA